MNQINAFDVFKTFLIDPSTYTNHFKNFISSPNNLFHIIEIKMKFPKIAI
jgi:hypothetical protein